MDFKGISDLFEEIALLHYQNPEMYYFGEGDESIVTKCSKALSNLKQYRQMCFFESSDAIPFHPAFHLIKQHMEKIVGFYGKRKIDLLSKFIKQLIPKKYRPLRHEVLRSITLCTCMIHLEDDQFHPDPILAHIDGYYNLVAPVEDIELRIPLIPINGQNAITLPPSIRFVTLGGEEDAPRDFIINQAPTIGRKSQLNAFISILSRTDPHSDLFSLIRDSITSFDLSFAIAVCALASDPHDFNCPNLVINILGCSKLFDHLLRSLSCVCSQFVAGRAPNDNPELVAMKNMVIATASEWCKRITQGDSLETLVDNICNAISKRIQIPEVTIYIMRAALTIASYEDPSGLHSIAMFMEVLISPFAVKYGMTDQFRELKEGLLEGNTNFDHVRKNIEDTIIDIMAMDANIQFHSPSINDDIQAIYRFILQHIDPFIRIVILLNARNDLDHPVFRSMLFSYMKGVEFGLFADHDF